MDGEPPERILGRVDEAVETLKGSVRQILENQESARHEHREIYERHALDDKAEFAKINEGLGLLRDRIAVFEGMSDGFESHGDAIKTMETRITKLEQRGQIEEASEAAVGRNNDRWQRGVIATATAVGVAAGGAGTSLGPKVWKAFMSIFGKV
jgi:hypothetical protein